MSAMFEAKQVLKAVPEVQDIDMKLLEILEFASIVLDPINRGRVVVACARLIQAPLSGEKASWRHKMGRAGYARVVKCGRYRIAYDIVNNQVVFERCGLEDKFYDRK